MADGHVDGARGVRRPRGHEHAPAHAATAEGHIVIGFQEAPVTAGTYALDGGGDLVASITGTVDGVDVTGSSCEVRPPAAGLVAGGASTLIAACAGSDVEATLRAAAQPRRHHYR